MSNGLYCIWYNKVLDHVANNVPVDAWFIGKTENIREMETAYQNLGQDITRFLDWLKNKCDGETDVEEGTFTSSEGAAIFTTLGGD